MTDKRTLTISALNRYLKLKLDQDPHLHSLFIKGEISNFNHHRSGHMYFTLKDDQSRISAVMFRGNNRSLPFNPENGMQVVVEGAVSIYEAYGEYQIYVKQMQPDGIGSLYMAYEQLKEKLRLEGLFDDQHKLPLPKYPEHIGVITSPTGAAVRDMITTIQRRNPLVQITVIPTQVQGKEAIPSIIRQIKYANEYQLCDVLLVGRGGGSIEDLWAFNDEQVVRTIFESNIPIISAVGHETDTTISDYVADVRASTPTGAAELAVKEQQHLIEAVQSMKQSIKKSLRHQLLHARGELQSFKQARPFQHPEQMLRKHRQTIDYMEMNMDQQMKQLLTRKQYGLQQHNIEKQRQILQMKMANCQSKLQHQKEWLTYYYQQQCQWNKNRMSILMEKLILLNPLTILHRGYALPFNQKDEIIRSVDEVKTNDCMNIQLHDGKISANVRNVWRDTDVKNR